MAKYQRLAEIYDQLSEHDYVSWAAYLLSLAGDIHSAVDAGCGTGSITLELARKGIHITGLDLSGEMLDIAAEKARKRGLKVPFSQQNICDFSLHSPVDCVISTCDTVNYLLSEEELLRAFTCAYGALKENGKYIFDVLTLEHMRSDLPGFFGADLDDFSYIWENTFDEEERVLNMDITFFVRREGDLYERFVELHRQKGYSLSDITALLEQAGFKSVKAYHAFTTDAPAADSERVCFVAEK